MKGSWAFDSLTNALWPVRLLRAPLKEPLLRLPKKVVSGMTGAEYVLFTIYTEDLFRSATPTSLMSLHQSVHPIDPVLKCTKDPAALLPIASLQRPNLSHSVHWSTVLGSVRSAYTTGHYFNELVSQTIAESRVPFAQIIFCSLFLNQTFLQVYHILYSPPPSR